MSPIHERCLVLACGNPLRSDDGVGPWLAQWTGQRFRNDARVRVLCRQQWTPELAADLARAASALFLDCSVANPAGTISVCPVEPAPRNSAPGTHHLEASDLLALSAALYEKTPHRALLLTVGAGSTELGSSLSAAVAAALPAACRKIEETIQELINEP